MTGPATILLKKSRDGPAVVTCVAPAVHYEHTVVVTEVGAQVVTT